MANNADAMVEIYGGPGPVEAWCMQTGEPMHAYGEPTEFPTIDAAVEYYGERVKRIRVAGQRFEPVVDSYRVGEVAPPSVRALMAEKRRDEAQDAAVELAYRMGE